MSGFTGAYPIETRSGEVERLRLQDAALAEATQNPIIPILMDSIIDLLREQRKRTGLTKGGLQRGQIHHKKILDAVARHDAETAHQAMQDHLKQVRKDSKTSTVDAG